MKKLLVLTWAILMIVTISSAQVENPVKWTFSTANIEDQEAELVFKATIDHPWHLYSAKLPAGGPIATKPYYNESDAYSLVDGIVEVTKPKIKFDEGFQMDVGTLAGKAEFRQKVKFSGTGTQTVTGEIEFQVCDDVTCLPPQTVEFSFVVNVGGEAAAAVEESAAVTVEESAAAEETSAVVQASETKKSVAGVPALEDEKSLWRFFWLAFGLGLLALLTPCVFPMIPMTVSFFMQGSDSRARGIFRGLVFGISITAIYTLLGVIVSVSNVGPNA
ncbi:MAG: hypothetical protein KAR16_10215, partial [Bacteroidales bacterium]|nr:hypothetical protein [Bacteroidales bacterium]